MLGRALNRVRQGLLAISMWFREVDDSLAVQVLSPAQLAIFRRMRKSEQQHSLNVLRTLHRDGYDETALNVAALLHDVGKSRFRYNLLDRTLVTLVRAFAPHLALEWGSGSPRGWRRPFAVMVQHPAWSAELAAQAGTDPVALELIARHQVKLKQPPRNHTEELLTALQSADDAN
jgi:predicted hydrolase (HD superfamily)